jgi:tyrosyl-tRNA synthetase
MAGRRLQEVFGQKPQVCLTFPVLVGTDGVERMSKSRGNYIGVTELPEQIYGKVMSIPDSLIMDYFELLTDVPNEELAEFKKQLDNGANPMELKKRLARELVTQLYSKKEADEAEKHFSKVVQKKEVPDKIQEFKISTDIPISRLLLEAGLVTSRSEANRLIQQGAVSIDGQKVTDANQLIMKNIIIKVGKRRFVKVINTDRQP